MYCHPNPTASSWLGLAWLDIQVDHCGITYTGFASACPTVLRTNCPRTHIGPRSFKRGPLPASQAKPYQLATDRPSATPPEARSGGGGARLLRHRTSSWRHTCAAAPPSGRRYLLRRANSTNRTHQCPNTDWHWRCWRPRMALLGETRRVGRAENCENCPAHSLAGRFKALLAETREVSPYDAPRYVNTKRLSEA
jgi:hypothetical protein